MAPHHVRTRLSLSAAILLGITAAGAPARAQSTLPSGGHVVAGSATIGAPSGSTLSVTQGSNRAVVNWNTFSVGAPNAVNFAQPGASAAILNRVTGDTSSTIAGRVTGNGQVYLVNPNGVAITPSGSVQVGGGFVASTLGISTGDFMSGNLAFTGNGASAGVSNAGRISVGPGGYAALIGGTAANSGVVSVPLGKVALGSGERATLDLNGDGFMQVAAPTGTTTAKGQPLVSNSGRIEAAGGAVEMKAATVASAIRNAVNMSGVVAANSVSGHDGAITLGGGPGGGVSVTGTLDASAPVSGPANGGRIIVDGARAKIGHHAVLNASGAKGGSVLVGVSGPGGQDEAGRTKIASGAQILAHGDPTVAGSGGYIETSGINLKLGNATIEAGRGGTWLTDPVNLTIDASAAITIANALNAGTNVTAQTTATGASGSGTVTTGSGDITVAAALAWSSSATLTLSAFNNITVSAPITVSGAGTLVLTYNNNVGGANTAGVLSFVMGQGSAQFTGGSGAGASLFINNGTPGSGNGTQYTLIYDTGATSTGIQSLNGSSGHFALAVPLDATSLGTIFEQQLVPSFSGDLNGLGNTISNLTLNATGNNQLGTALFGAMSGTIENLGIVGASLTLTGDNDSGAVLALVNSGTIANSYVTGSIKVTGNNDSAGGLALTNNGTITNSYIIGTINITGSGNPTGGLANTNNGTITNSHATASVTIFGVDPAGVLANTNNGTITDSYAAGSVTITGVAGSDIGGLVSDNSGTISGSFTNVAIGPGSDLSGGTLGGLAGTSSGSIANSYALGAITGGTGSHVGGLVGDLTGGGLTNVFAAGPLGGSGSTVGGIAASAAIGTPVAGAYFDTTSTGATTGININGSHFTTTGESTAALASALPSGFSPIVWGNANNLVSPYLLNNIGLVIAGSDTSSRPTLYNLVFTPTQLQNINNNLSGNYALANDIDATGVTGFVPIGGFPAAGGTGVFSGTFNGLGNVVANLAIIAPNGNTTGLFGASSGTIKNIGVVGGSVTDTNQVDLVGGLVGDNQGKVINSYSTASVSSVGGGFDSLVGGLVGANEDTGAINNAYATGAVTGDFGAEIGGLVGINNGTITNAYATGAVIGGGSSTVGGLVGNNSGGTMTNTYAAGSVSGGSGSTIGGLVGATVVGIITNGYFDADRSAPGTLVIGQDAGGNTLTNVTALSGSQPFKTSSYAGFNFTSTPGATGNNWVIVDSEGSLNNALSNGVATLGRTLPMLASEAQSTIQNAHQLQLMEMNLTANYALGRNIDATATGSSTGNSTGTDVWTSAGFVPIAAFGNPGFTGTFDGAEHTITGLTIDAPLAFAGLFGYSPGSVKNVGLVGGSLTNTLAVVGSSGSTVAGSLVGWNDGHISNSFSSMTVGGVATLAGGLVGLNEGTIVDVYATGAVTNTNPRALVGGLVGQDDATLTNAYATGAVSGSGHLGGLVGSKTSVLPSNALYDAETTGQPLGTQIGGTIGETTAALQAGLPTGFSPTIWGIVAGKSYPYLCWQVGGCGETPQVVTGTVYKDFAGTSAAGSGITVSGLVNGNPLASLLTSGAIQTGANGYYYYLLAPNTISSGGGVLTYATGFPVLGGGTANGSALADQFSGTASGLTILPNTQHEITPDTKASVLAQSLSTALGGATITGLINQRIDASGAFDVDATIRLPSLVTGLLVLNAGTAGSGAVTESTGRIIADSLAVGAPGPVSLTSPQNNVANLAAAVTGAGNAFQYDSLAGVTIATVNGVAGVSTNAGDISLSASGMTLDQQVNAGAANTVTLSSSGGIGQGTASGVITAASLSAAAAQGVALASFANHVDTLTGSAGDAFAFADSGPLTIGVAGVSAGSGATILSGGDLTIAAGATIAGNGVVLSTPGNFINNQGAGAVTATGGGRWLIYSNAPGGDNFGGLDSDSTAIWGATFATLPPASVTAAGNRYLFAQTQTLTVTTTNVAKTYGQDATAAVATAFTESGFASGVANAFLADTAANVVTGTPSVTSTGSATSASVAGSPYQITRAAGSLTVESGYSLAFVDTGVLTVNPAALTVTASNQSKVYGQSLSLGTTAFTTSGLVNSDSVSGVTLASPGAAATANVAGSPYAISASSAVGSGLGNYTIGYVNGALSVTPAALTVTASNQSKVYGQSLSLGTTAFTTSGLVNSDSVSGVSLSSPGAAATANVAGSPYAISASSAVGSGLGNYTIGYVNGVLSVTPAALTVTASNQSKVYGQSLSLGTTAFTTSGLVNSDSVSGVSLSSPGAAATANVAGSPYAISASSAVGSGLANYTIGYVNGALSVTPAGLTVTASNQSKVYGQSLALGTTAFTTSGLVNSDSVSGVTLSSPGAAATANVAGSPYAIAASNAVGSGLANYTIGYVNGVLSVTPAALTVTASNQSKVYGQTASLGTTAFTTSGLVNSDSVSGVTLSSPGAAATASVAGSPYAISASSAVGSGLANYTIGYANGALSVTPAGLTVTASNQSKVYGQSLALGTTAFTTSGLVNSDSVSGVTLASPGAAATANVAGSPYAISASSAVGSGLGNYTIGYVNGVLSVTPAALTVTASNQSKVYGQSLSLGTTAFTTSGLVNSDSVSGVSLSSPGAAATANVAGSPYAISASAAVGSGLGNYTISYANGALSVTPAALTVTASNQSKVYGQSLSLGTTAFTTSGLVNSDSVSGVTPSSPGAAATANVAGSPYAISASSAVGSGLANYTIGYVNGALSVTPAGLTVTASNQSKVYGQSLALGTTAFTTSGLVNSDSVSGVTLASPGAAATANVAGSPYAISASSAVGSGLGNYTIGYVNGALSVTPAALTVTASNQSKVYGQSLSLGTTAFTTSGLVNSDRVSGVTLASPGAAATANVAGSPYAISASSAVGSGLGNYTIGYVNGVLSVTPAALTVTASNQSKVYGQSLSLGTTAFTTSGLVNSDSVSGVSLSSPGAAATANVAGSPYAISTSSAVGSGLGNYAISYANGALSVTPAALTVTASNQSKVYGQSLALGTTAFTTSGLVNSDSVSGVTLSSPGAAATANVAGSPYAISASSAVGSGLGNYTIGYVNGVLSVTPAALTVTASNQSKVYGQSLSLGTTAFTTSGLVNSDSVSGVSLSSPGAAATANVAGSPYAISTSSAVGSGLGNYTISYANGALSVTPAALTVTASDLSRPFSQPNPPLTFAVTAGNLVNGDALSGGLATTAVSGSLAGLYPITQGTLVATSNYALTFLGGTLLVTALPDLGVSPNKFLPPVSELGPPPQSLSPCSPSDLVSTFEHSGSVVLFGAQGGACGSL